MNILIVLNYNDYKTTKEFVSNVKDYTNLNKIIIVDNHSTDDSFAYLQTLANSKIDIIQSDKNKGYAGGNNLGVRYAISHYSPKYIFIANPDIEITERLVTELIHTADKKDNMGMLSGHMICTSGIHMPAAWKLPRFKDCILENLILLRRIIGNKTEYNKSHFNCDISKVEVLPGSFFLITSKAFEAINGFDDKTFLYYEENILAYKLKVLGYENYILNNISYKHRHSVSINKSISSVKKRLKLGYDSRLIYCKNYLKVETLHLWILKITFYVGLFNYLVALKILDIKR